MITKLLTAAAVAGLVIAAAPAVHAQDAGLSKAARIAHGGQIYDKWWKTLKTAEPKETHASYPAGSKKSGSTTWRCKECHGWDYVGAEGRYSGGSHFTGIKGVSGSKGGDPAAVIASLRGATHGFTAEMIDDAAMADLALFITEGQYDAMKYIVDGAAQGDVARGQATYQTVCAGCHGLDGKKVKDMPAMAELSGNAPEMMHKIMYGQPTEAMPALHTFGAQLAADVAAYAATMEE